MAIIWGTVARIYSAELLAVKYHPMKNGSSKRKAHTVFDLPSRRNKALKIERLLGLSKSTRPIRLLEIGTGSGGIAHYFATHPTLHCEVTAVDVADQRLVKDGYLFIEVLDTNLPFADASFDIVLTNHVIEHVGGPPAQRHHLSEVYRVMTHSGLGYLAVPNRWQLIEPHYRLILLSWLPQTLRSPYMRLMNKGDFYDCRPLSLWELESLLLKTGYIFSNLSLNALQQTLDIEGGKGILVDIAASFPERLFNFFAPIVPTLIYSLFKEPLNDPPNLR